MKINHIQVRTTTGLDRYDLYLTADSPVPILRDLTAAQALCHLRQDTPRTYRDPGGKSTIETPESLHRLLAE